jgi:osmoprotectant transport system permease protein
VIPSLALLALLIPICGLGFKPALVALSIYALLPIVQNTYTGIISIAPEYMDLARSLALKPWTIISRVQVPMALATIIAGIRTSSVICIGAATLATFVGAGGLGDLIKAGIDLNSNYMIALGAVPAAVLALSVSYALSLVEKRLG